MANEKKRDVESMKKFQLKRRLMARRIEIERQMSNINTTSIQRRDPAESISTKSRRMAEKFKRYYVG